MKSFCKLSVVHFECEFSAANYAINRGVFMKTLTLIISMVIFSCHVSSVEAGFPLSTEDTGTLGQDRTKIEWNNEWAVDRASGAREVALVSEFAMVHGLLNTLNGFIAVPYRDVRTYEAADSSAHVRGAGDIKLGLKWRYMEQGGLSLGLKTIMTAPTGDDAKQLGSGKSTQAINAIASYETGPWEFDLDLGYKHNGNTLNQREQLGSISFAVVRGLDSGWKIMADIGAASNKNKRSSQALAYLGAGLSYEMSKAVELNLGVKRGISNVETDFTGLAGVALRF